MRGVRVSATDIEAVASFQSATSHFFAAPALAPAQTPVYHVFSGTWQSPLAF